MEKDFSNLGLPPCHPFNLEVQPFTEGYYGFSLYINGEFAGSYCSPFTLYYDFVTKFLPRCLKLNL